MLREFLAENREDLIERCRLKVAMRRAPRATPRELSHGVPHFLDQLMEVFPPAGGVGAENAGRGQKTAQEIVATATRHGQELLKHDFTIEQVVHDYGDLCQSITELAAELRAPITVEEFGCLNSTLDNAIASAVASYSADHEAAFGEGGQVAARDRLGALANAMRNLLNTAILAGSAMKRGSVGTEGATAAALDRSLICMRRLIDRALAEVRLESSAVDTDEMIEIGPFIAAIQLAAVLEATSTQCELTVVVEPDIFVRGDRHLLASAVANLLHGALASTQPGGGVFLSARAREGRILIDIEDVSTGLEPEVLGQMLARFARGERSGGGMGSMLDSARRAVEANGGKLTAEAVPSKGCLYTLDLPEVV
ncbi:MAG TPA: HAMP domain-containing sensor histidine kinase [Usitatibacter sp.]|nr:HAMP domain-containing sensor histidine kinase [Usitatibacter sp.]